MPAATTPDASEAAATAAEAVGRAVTSADDQVANKTNSPGDDK
jgi:hypothetical protein